MTDREIVLRIDGAIAEEFELDPAQMKPEARLFEDLGLDSLDIVDLVIVLENAFGFKIREDPALREIRTLGGVHKYVIDKHAELSA